MLIYGFSELSCTPLYPRYLEFRNQVFNQVLKYNRSGNPIYQLTAFDLADNREYGVEYDHYDTPKTLHLACIDRKWQRQSIDRSALWHDPIIGCLRLLPTDGPYMIRDAIERGLWKVELFDVLPAHASVYEASRIAVSPEIADPAIRKSIVDNLVYANVEIGVRLGVHRMVGIMYDRMWNAVYVKRGIPIRYLSKPFHVDDGEAIIIGEIDTSPAIFDELNRRYSEQLAQGSICMAQVEPSAWMLHCHKVRMGEVRSQPVPDHAITASAQRQIQIMLTADI